MGPLPPTGAGTETRPDGCVRSRVLRRRLENMDLRFTLSLVVAATIGVSTGCGGGGGGSSKPAGPGNGNNGGNNTTTTQGTVTQVGSLATGRTAHTATWIPTVKKVLVAGGKGKSGSTDAVLDSAELFD